MARVLSRALTTSVAMGFLTVLSLPTAASLLNFEVTVTKPLLYVDEGLSIGGPATPVILDVSVDSQAPNFSGVTTQGDYLGTSANVGIGVEVAPLGSPVVQTVAYVPGVYLATFNEFGAGSALGTGIDERQVFSVLFDIFDNGPMLTSIDLPLDSSFATHAQGGFMQIVFRPKPTDPEFPTGTLLPFSTFFGSADFSLKETIAEPGSLALVGIGLASLGFLSRKRKR